MKRNKLFSINGYWKNDRSSIDGCLVKDGPVNSRTDDTIFFYMTENELREAVRQGEKSQFEFVVTSYEEA